VAGRGIYFTALGAGVLLFWSGFKGWGIMSTLQDIIAGKQPTGPAVNAPLDPVTAQSIGQVSSGIGGGGGIYSDAMQYVGHAYLYGGSPGSSGANPWDCSSFCNWVVSHDLNLAWPGTGRYDGTSHGPPTGQWGAWLIAKGMRVSGGIASAQAGDIIVWAGHMGIAAGNGNMVSALNHIEGTKVTPIAGYGNGPLLCVGRYQ
jgi:cell wall-associated NlpC family hydrolase